MNKFLFWFAFIVSIPFAQAQEPLPTQIQAYFERIQKEFPTEKAYLHLDKRTYTLGDDLWFSAYLTAGSRQIPSPLSKTLYVDIFDGDGLLLEQRKVQMETGRGKGDFKIPRFGKAGQYQIKAYTAWMRNFGEEYFFTTQFTVVDADGGSFLPNVRFTEIASSDGKARYSTKVIAASQGGNPLANQPIEVIVWGDQEELYRQEVSLNGQGEVSFSFSIPEKPYSSQHLELIYLENGDYPVSKKIAIPYSLNLVDVQFLPEGGHWVVGKKSVVAFRAVAPDGNPVDVYGSIGGQEFRTTFGGMGKIELTPEQADYQAEVTHPFSGQTKTINLPKADSEGFAMQVVNNPTASFITALVQGTQSGQNLILVSQTRSLINYMIQGSLTNGVWGVRIPKENLIDGINHLTVLTEDGKPLLERLIFVQKEEIDLDLVKSGNLTSRGKLSLSLSSSVEGTPIPGSFSISVTDADQVKDESLTYGGISAELLLNSDLKGQLFQPGYYFKDQNPETLEALDLVMLTHGWRRFTWDQVTSATFPKIDHFIETGINIEGQITEQTESKKGLGGGQVSAVIGEGLEIVSSEYGPNGRFILRDMIYQDSARVTITVDDKRVKDFVNIEIIQPEAVFTGISGQYPTKIEWPEALIATFKERNLQQQLLEDPEVLDLEGVTVEGKTLEREEEEIRKIYGSGDVTINPDNIPGNVAFTNIFQLIQGRVSGVQVYVAGLDVQVLFRGQGSLSSGTQPLYLLDNNPVDAGTLLQVNPRDVASVDVFKDPARAAIFGAQGANGVIAVYTKTGSGISNLTKNGTLVTQYGGYSAAREFYLPKYDIKSVENAAVDKRATIFWDPLVQVDASGKVNLEFYNSDQAKRHLVVIEGMDEAGRIGRLVKIIE